ncbi:MAG TPA: argininosuccinate synthase [Myxococcales bacterium]|nr:argininosuccinate synthase [Myxococcales bacterium]HBU48916.1 argininosuccinate synthase [Myxococcales bacterium]
MTQSIKKVVLAYSGGLDTTVILHWLKETYDCEVVCFAADLGQGEELDPLEEKAAAAGSTIYIDDLREEFVRDFVFPAVRANAVYEGVYLLGTSLARPLIGKRMVEIAEAEGADAISHGATGKGNDQVRFELTAYALKPDIKVIAPWRDWSYKGRKDLLEYCEARGLQVEASAEKPYSMDANAMHISYEGGILEDPWREPDASMFKMTVNPEDAPDRPEYMEIRFEAGDAVAVDGREMSPFELLTHLNERAGAHGIGRVDIVENRFVGMKSRGVYETPGVTVLLAAHRAIESITLDREVAHYKDELVPRYAKLVYNGFWYAPERQLLQQTIDQSQRDVTGTVRVKMYKGSAMVVGRKAKTTLYDPEVASFEAEEVYNQADADGFIKLNALRLRRYGDVHGYDT